jgi:ribonucleoside-triphosphate reductase
MAETTSTIELPKRTKCEIWTRVMGYHRPVSQYNLGKKSEFYSRTYFQNMAQENAKLIERYGQTSLIDEVEGRAQLLLFSTSTCPKCPAVKNWLETSEIEYESIDNRRPDFYELAERYGVQSVPTLIAIDKNGNEMWRAKEQAEMVEMMSSNC